MARSARQLLAASGLARTDAQALLTHVLGVNRAWLIAHADDIVPAPAAARFDALAARRLAGEPVAYLVGEREFMGHVFRVTPAVLIPRPDTETLVEAALDTIAGLSAPRVLDLGTGSGAIAISVALARPDARVDATDLSDDALAVAGANARALDAPVTFHRGDWFGALPDDARYDLIVSNPPYIASDDPHLAQGDLRFEPRGALTDHGDGLGDLRTLVQGAAGRLRPGGALWLEHGWRQAAAVRALLCAAGYRQVESRQDLAGIERISGGRAPGA